MVVEDLDLLARGVRFRVGKTGVGPPVVLLPGSGGWRLTFARLAEQLAVDHTVYAVDPPGQGGTRVVDPKFGFDVDAIADALAGLLDELALDRLPVIGHSWGGGYALRIAELHPRRVAALALLAPAGIVARDIVEFRLLRLPVLGELMTRFTSSASVRHLLRKSFVNADRLPQAELIRAAAKELRTGPSAATLRRDLLRVERRADWAATERDLSLVSCQVLILWGARDRYLPVTLLDRFTAALADVRTSVVPGAGHSVHDDVPGEVDPQLTDFLSPRR